MGRYQIHCPYKNAINPQIAQLNINGRMIDVPKHVANEVNNFFVNVGPNTEKEVPKVPKYIQRFSLKIKINSTLL